jgi:hypothetical protein
VRPHASGSGVPKCAERETTGPTDEPLGADGSAPPVVSENEGIAIDDDVSQLARAVAFATAASSFRIEQAGKGYERNPL